MFCTKCGKQIPDNSVCPCQQQQQQQQQFTPPQGQQGYNQFQAPPPSDNRKAYSVMSYIGILWLIGLLVSPEKNDPRVRFNVGQGIILSIVSTALGIVVAILSFILGLIFRSEITAFGYGTGVYEVSGVAVAISTLLWFAVWGASIALMVIGIVNVCKNQDKPLPIIGGFAFYR